MDPDSTNKESSERANPAPLNSENGNTGLSPKERAEKASNQGRAKAKERAVISIPEDV